MNIIKKILGNDNNQQEPIFQNPFEKWPYPQSEPYYRANWDIVGRIIENGALSASLDFNPSIIVGLGSSGMHVLQEFATLMKHSSVPVNDPSCAMIGFSSEETNPSTLKPFRSWIYRSFEERHLISGGLSNCFAHIEDNVGKNNATIFIVGSLSDYEFKNLADLIQIIRLNTKINQNIRHIIGIFSVSNLKKGTMTNEKDIYARMRELNRFQFNGPHWMETPFNEQSGIIYQELLDHVFLIGDKSGINQPKVLENLTRSITEFLAIMVNKDSNDIWSKIHAEADPKERGIPLYNTFSLCLLDTPVREIINYASIRLARDVLYNKNNEADLFGFFQVDTEKRHFFEEENLAKQWLETDKYFSYHPLFQWVAYFEERKIFDLNHIPLHLFEADFKSLFQTQITNCLVDFLNDADEKDRIYKAKRVITWVDGKVKLIQEALTSHIKEIRSENLIDFRKTINSFHEFLDSLIQQLVEWEHLFIPFDQLTSSDSPKSTGNTNGWSILQESKLSVDEKETSILFDELSSLYQSSILDIQSENYASDGAVIARYPVIGFGRDAIKEVERIYDSCVNSDVNTIGSNSFHEKIRNRIGWDVEFSKFEHPKLVFICIPPDKSGNDLHHIHTAKGIRFSSENVTGLIESILIIATELLRKIISEELSGKWFSSRLWEKVDYLSKVNNNRLLEFDFESAMKINPKLSVINTVTIPKTTVEIDFAGVVYPNSIKKDVSLIRTKQIMKTVAIKFTLDIPVNTVSFYDQISRNVLNESKFRFPQEKNVVRYEQKIQNSGHSIIISPDLARCFVDVKLVSLFCQAYFYKIIELDFDQIAQSYNWIISFQPAEKNRSYSLSKFSEGSREVTGKLVEFDGLLDAFYAFTNKEPHKKDILSNGSLMFFEKEKFVNLLKDNITEIESTHGADIKKERYAELQRYFEVIRGMNRLDLESFYHVLLVEYDYPGWKEIIWS